MSLCVKSGCCNNSELKLPPERSTYYPQQGMGAGMWPPPPRGDSSHSGGSRSARRDSSASSLQIRPNEAGDAPVLMNVKPADPLPGSMPARGNSGAASGAYNGTWADGKHVHIIKGTTIYWADGMTTEMEDTSPGHFSTTLWGTAYHGAVDKNCQAIHWNDGCEWIRLELEGLDGEWQQESEVQPQRHAIRGNTLHWSDGSTTEIQETRPGFFSTIISGQTYHCHLEHGGQRLRWSDGDSWVRAQQQKRSGVSVQRMRFVLLVAGLATLVNAAFVAGVASYLHRDWNRYPAEPLRSQRQWSDVQVWQFVVAWSAMPLLLVHGAWAAYLAIAVGNGLPKSMEMQAGSDVAQAGAAAKPALLWLLEPMRFVALLHIIWYHEVPENRVGRWGFAWITFFMILAGFVGGYQLLTHDPDASKTLVCEHVWKRVKRLWPLYLLYIFMNSVPGYFEDSLAKGSIFPSLEGTVSAARKLFSWTGLLYVLGLQTLIPLDPHFKFVNMTCWFVPSLLICEALLPLWLRGIHALLELAALRAVRRAQLLSKVEPSRLLSTALALVLLAGFISSASAANLAFGKVYLRLHAFPDHELSETIFWYLRFTPFGHWPQVLLGAILAKTFMMMQSRDPEGSEYEGCCPEEVVPLALMPPTRSLVLVQEHVEDSGPLSGLWQALRCWPWFLGAAFAGALAALSIHTATHKESNTTVIFLNDGAPGVAFAALIICLAQASLELQPSWLLRKCVTIVGAVCFPSYLFVGASEEFLWYYFSLVTPQNALIWALWLRIPFLALVQQLWDLAGMLTKAA